MDVYKIKYWFEHGGGCLWGDNNVTKDKNGYFIAPDLLSLSDILKRHNFLTAF